MTGEPFSDRSPEAAGDTQVVVEQETLFFGLAHDRLRRRCRWTAPALVLSVLVPYEVIDEQPQMLWQLFDELPLAAILAGLAPAVAGAVLLSGLVLSRRGTSLAILALAALSGWALCYKLGSDAAAWGLLPLPASIAGRSTSALLAMALTAAGSSLSRRPSTRRPAHALLAAAAGSALLFYGWPDRGEAPGITVLNNLAAIGDMPTIHFKLGAITVAVVALWPALTALLGLAYVRRPPLQSPPVLGMLALFGFPLLLAMLLFSWYLRSSPGAALFAALGATLELTAVLALAAAALEVLGHLFGRHPRAHAEPDGWPPRRSALVALVAVIAVGSAQAWLARPPAKGVRWPLDAPKAAADALFGERIVRWSAARFRWEVASDDSGEALLEVEERGRDMVTAGAAVDGQLGAALDALAQAGRRLDVGSRGWYRLVADVNEACRRARLPYYLDPRVSIRKTGGGLQRHLLVDAYRIVRARRFSVDGAEHATLHVRGLGPLRGGHRLGLLGFSRDVQPFALVVLDTIDRHFDELKRGATESPPRCGRAYDPTAEQAMLRCGALLARMLADEPGAMRATVNEVERHELQHQIDGPLLTLARPVLQKLAGYTGEAQERANRELSAYLAQLTQLTSPAKLGLILPLRLALLEGRGTYHHAGVLLFEALGHKPVRDAAGAVDPARVLEVFDELTALDDESLRRRAAAAHEALYGDPLPTVVLLEETAAPDP